MKLLLTIRGVLLTEKSCYHSYVLSKLTKYGADGDELYVEKWKTLSCLHCSDPYSMLTHHSTRKGY